MWNTLSHTRGILEQTVRVWLLLGLNHQILPNNQEVRNTLLALKNELVQFSRNMIYTYYAALYRIRNCLRISAKESIWLNSV